MHRDINNLIQNWQNPNTKKGASANAHACAQFAQNLIDEIMSRNPHYRSMQDIILPVISGTCMACFRIIGDPTKFPQVTAMLTNSLQNIIAGLQDSEQKHEPTLRTIQ